MSGSSPSTRCTASVTARVSSRPQRGESDQRAIACQRKARAALSMSAVPSPAA